MLGCILTGNLSPVCLSVIIKSSKGTIVFEFFTFDIWDVYVVGTSYLLESPGNSPKSTTGLLIVILPPTNALEASSPSFDNPLSIFSIKISFLSISGELLLIILPRDLKLLNLNGSILELLRFLNISNDLPTSSLVLVSIVGNPLGSGSGIGGKVVIPFCGVNSALPVIDTDADTGTSTTYPFNISDTVTLGWL